MSIKILILENVFNFVHNFWQFFLILNLRTAFLIFLGQGGSMLILMDCNLLSLIVINRY